MSVDDKIRYGRTCSLVLNKSVTVLRRVVEHSYITQGLPSLEVFLNNNKHALFHLLFKKCCCGNKSSVIPLSKYQWKLMYTRSSSVNPHGQEGECPCQYTAISGVIPDVMDFSLCCLVLHYICSGVSMPDVDTIKGVRNQLIHVSTASLDVTSYLATWSKLQAAILNLAQGVSSLFRSDTARAIQALKDRKIGLSELSALQTLVMEEKRISENQKLLSEIKKKQGIAQGDLVPRTIHADARISHDESKTESDDSSDDTNDSSSTGYIDIGHSKNIIVGKKGRIVDITKQMVHDFSKKAKREKRDKKAPAVKPGKNIIQKRKDERIEGQSLTEESSSEHVTKVFRVDRQNKPSSDYKEVYNYPHVVKKAMQTVTDKYQDLMPPEIKVKYYDVMILYSDEDREAAKEYKRHLTEDIVLDGGHRIKAVLYDDLEMAPSSGSQIMGFQLSLQRCTFMFVFLTKAFCECEWWVFSSEVCFLEAILNPQKKWCVVPVYTVQRNKADFKIPIGLRSLKRVHYYHNDQFCMRYVKRLIGDKLHVRIKREFEQSKKQHTWHFEQLNKRGKLKFNSKPPIGSRKHEEEYRRSDPRPSSKPMFLSLRKRLDKYRQSKSKYVQSVQESHSASQKLDRDHRNLPVKRTDLGESFVSNEFANICHLSLDEVPLDLEQSSDSDHSVQTTDLGEHFISNEVADLFRITMDEDTLDLEQSIGSDHSVQTTDLEDIADICNVSLNEDTVDLEQSSDRDHNAETPLSHYRTSTSASLRLNQFSRSTPSEMTDAFVAYDSHPRHDVMQLGPVEISSDRYNGEKMLLKDITDDFKVQFSSEFTIQIFSSKEGNIVHFINKENEGIGIMDVQPHFFLGIPVLTINQGLDSDENVRINEYLFRNHRTCSCVELEQIDNIINQHLDSLFANHSNLQSVSSSCIKSYDKEKRIAIIPCIVLYCSLKGYIPLEEEKFPEHIEDIPTDVREGYAFATGPGDVNNPLGLGCSIGALGRGECGSLGVFTENGSSETGFISCAHVFFSYAALKRNVEENRGEILIETETEIKVRQPGGSVHDHSTDTVCGRVRSGWYGNIRVTDPFTKEELDVTVDLATVQLTDRAPSRHLMQPEIDQNLRELSGLSDWPNYNFSCCQMELDDLERHVYKCGAKTHLTKGSIKMIGSTYKKGNYRDPRSPIHLKNQFEIQSCHIAETQTPSSLPGVQEPFISPGDSGSVVFIKKNVENIHPIGLATGVLLSKLCGRSVPIKCFATPFFAVEAALRKIEPGSMIRNFQKRRELDLPIQTLTDNFQRMTTQQIPANTNRQVTA